MSRLHKPLRDRKSNKLGEGPFLDPVSGTSENSKITDLQVRLFVTNLMLCSNLFIHSIMSRLHKPLKRSLQSPNPKEPIFWTCLWDPKTRKA